MPREIQQLVNSPMLWMITLMSIALVLGMAAYFLVKSIKVAKSIGVTKEQISITVKTAGISAVAPSVVIAVGMISLLVMVGAPQPCCGFRLWEMWGMNCSLWELRQMRLGQLQAQPH